VTKELNKVLLIGRVGRDPELEYTPRGQARCKLSVATHDRWYDKNTEEWKEITEWNVVSTAGKLAETCAELFRRGDMLYVEGRLQSRTFEDRKGIRRKVTEVFGRTVIKLEPAKKERSGDGEDTPPVPYKNPYGDDGHNSDGPPDDIDDDIPF